jgi:hypothetical protein
MLQWSLVHASKLAHLATAVSYKHIIIMNSATELVIKHFYNCNLCIGTICFKGGLCRLGI